ncbi:MarR family winged helix-turn-helix transcriptional regulator [Pseudonocardia nigra]|uniref:MarR family winged helix-turn-helix transcriptional regulator n=1 Tax=Pseudonocardia nigra TaxID=1921578 RepID=UPI001C5CE7E9|nr:MarR family transcriptional regulator [Pseudonocardia nigra]
MNAPVDLGRRIGYQLKKLDTALRAEMEAALRPHGLGVTQYACLELLDQQPGLSNAELARGAFVTRQAMNVVLRGLQDDGLVHRADTADHGRARPATLTSAGRARLTSGRHAVLAVEARMLAGFDADRAEALLTDLDAMAAALRGTRAE